MTSSGRRVYKPVSFIERQDVHYFFHFIMGSVALDHIQRFTVVFEWFHKYSIRFLVFRDQLFVKEIDVAVLLNESLDDFLSGSAQGPDDSVRFTDFVEKLFKSDLYRAIVLGKILTQLQRSSQFPPTDNSVQLIELRMDRENAQPGQKIKMLHGGDGVAVVAAISILKIEPKISSYFTAVQFYITEKKLNRLFCEKIFAAVVKPYFKKYEFSKNYIAENEKQILKSLITWMKFFNPYVLGQNKYSKIINGLDYSPYNEWVFHENSPFDFEGERRREAENGDTITNYMKNLGKNMLEMTLDPTIPVFGGTRVLLYCYYVRDFIRKIQLKWRDLYFLYELFEQYFIDDGYLEDLRKYFGLKTINFF